MKIKLLLAVLVLFPFACKNAPKENTEQKAEETALINVQQVELTIDGMTCTGCENAIQKTIDEFDGVYFSKADHQKGIAQIKIDSTKVNLVEIEEAINNLGYSATGHKIIVE